MTLPKFSAIAFCAFLLLPSAQGQSDQSSDSDTQHKGEQIFLADSTSSDSTDTALEVPNVFTPNGDGIHDYFEVETDGVSVYKFMVFTRTGTQVYQSSSPRIFWDGTNNAGVDLSEGVYYYVLEGEGESNTHASSGFIYLFR